MFIITRALSTIILTSLISFAYGTPLLYCHSTNPYYGGRVIYSKIDTYWLSTKGVYLPQICEVYSNNGLSALKYLAKQCGWNGYTTNTDKYTNYPVYLNKKLKLTPQNTCETNTYK